MGASRQNHALCLCVSVVSDCFTHSPHGCGSASSASAAVVPGVGSVWPGGRACPGMPGFWAKQAGGVAVRWSAAYLTLVLAASIGAASAGALAAATGDFDGKWSGTYHCDKSPTVAEIPAVAADVVAVVKDDVFTLQFDCSSYPVQCFTDISGAIGSGGEVAVKGIGRLLGAKNWWPISFAGHFAAAAFHAEGTDRGRRCSITLAAAEPAPGSLAARARAGASAAAAPSTPPASPAPQTSPASAPEQQAAVRATPAARAQSAPDLGFVPGRYFALAIGNNDYRNDLPKLKTAVGDATAIGQVLHERYGFRVTLLKNATRHDILGALAELRSTLRLDDNLLIYFAGHGSLDDVTGRGYWLPIDAEANSNANWISTIDLADDLRAIDANHVLVVADSCYSGTLTRDIPKLMPHVADQRAWLVRMYSKRSRTALTSGGLEPVLDGGGSGHSLFAKALLDALSDNTEAMDGQSLFAAVRRPVVLNADQTPSYADIRQAGHDGGDFILVPRGAGGGAAAR